GADEDVLYRVVVTVCNAQNTAVGLLGIVFLPIGLLGLLANPAYHTEPDQNDDKYGDTWESQLDPYTNEIRGLLSTDSDGDNLTSLNEYRWQTIPIGPIGSLFPNALDYDNDNWTDGAEVAYWNNPANDAAADQRSVNHVAVADEDYNAHDYDEDGAYTTHD